ncbi:MAG TPA: T9SS type A sorting domain-containing protein, partial [Chitinophagaceae bacterium]|nr:T9SS type A sorting domain-containing protein [Chitinophagaceae bacterium]
NTVMAEPFDNISATTAGWTIGDVAGDNATAGKWIVAVPVSSVTNGDTVQTGHDHSTGSGKCAVTANAASASSQPGNSDVDGGRTSMITETYDLSKYNQPIVSYWRWYTNSQSSNNPGKDMWRVWVSYDNGGSWNMIEKTFKPDVRWRRNVFIPDLTKGTTIKMMFIATDSAATSAGGTWVEAAVDDIEILELGSGATVGLNNPAEQNSSIYPNPANDQLFIQCQQKGVLNYQISNAIGQVMMNGQLLKSQSSASLNTSSLPEGIYFVNIEVNGWKTIHRLVIKR